MEYEAREGEQATQGTVRLNGTSKGLSPCFIGLISKEVYWKSINKIKRLEQWYVRAPKEKAVITTTPSYDLILQLNRNLIMSEIYNAGVELEDGTRFRCALEKLAALQRLAADAAEALEKEVQNAERKGSSFGRVQHIKNS